MKPYWESDGVALHLGDCLDVLAGLPDASIDAMVTDPPAGIAFMGREWDRDKGGRDKWIAWLADRMEQAYRVLKPGGHALVWALPRTSHWTAMALEDAGFEIRDCVLHLFGSGFPKSLDVSKAIDRRRDDHADILRITSWLADQAADGGVTRQDIDAHMGTSDMGGWWLSRLAHRCAVPTWEQWLKLQALIGFATDMDAEVQRLNSRKCQPGEAWTEREVVGQGNRVRGPSDVQIAGLSGGAYDLTVGAMEASKQWEGWGTALKPGQEIWWLVRKPLAGTVAATVLEHGTGALNVDACRVGSGGQLKWSSPRDMGYHGGSDQGATVGLESPVGRWPTNLLLTHSACCAEDGICESDCPAGELDRQSGTVTSSAATAYGTAARPAQAAKGAEAARVHVKGRGDSGGASRFFPTFRYEAKAPTSERPKLADGTAHPTVKPLGLMNFLVRLVTPPGGVVLDPFAGSGTTGEACLIEGFRCLLIEADAKHAELIVERLSKPLQPTLFGGEAS